MKGMDMDSAGHTGNAGTGGTLGAGAKIGYGIGDFAANIVFQTVSMFLLYIFTDGFADQFGGPEDKKFKTINIRRLLSEIYNLQEDEQKRLLEKAIRDWMGDLPQVDDILFIGTRIP